MAEAVRVVVFGARECSLCRPASEAVARVVAELAAPPGAIVVHQVEIDGDPELEAAYRTSIPVVEIDGRRVAKYHVDEDALERRLRRALAG